MDKQHSSNRKGKNNGFWGKTHTPEVREKIRKSRLGKKHTEEFKKKMSLRMKGNKYSLGKKWSEKTRRLQSDLQKGEKSYLWRGGITPINKQIRHSLEYRLWRIAVFERDNFTCQICGEKGGTLNADHIKPFAFYPELRFAIDNGRTLCVECHRQTDTYSGRTKYAKQPSY